MDEGISKTLRAVIRDVFTGDLAFFTKTVMKGSKTGGSGHVYVPKDYIGCEAMIVIKKRSEPSMDEAFETGTVKVEEE